MSHGAAQYNCSLISKNPMKLHLIIKKQAEVSKVLLKTELTLSKVGSNNIS